MAKIRGGQFGKEKRQEEVMKGLKLKERTAEEKNSIYF